MMTILDLRIKYRFDTGLPPTYGKYDTNITGNQPGCNYKGALTNDYAQWLENLYGNLRLAYQKNTGEIAVSYGKFNEIKYRKGYKEWLEERTLRYENMNLFFTTIFPK